MRLIKFRGKRIDSGEWVYGSLDLNDKRPAISWLRTDKDGGEVLWFAYVEPYTEPTENLKPPNSGELESQQTCTQFDNIVKGGFREHNRLHIAAMCLQGMLSAGDYSGCPDSAWSELAKIALACADALLVEAQKGGE